MTKGEFFTKNKWFFLMVAIVLLIALGIWHPPTDLLKTLGDVMQGFKE